MANRLNPFHVWVESTLGFFFPETCQLCHAEHATAAEGFVGVQCRSEVRFVRPPFCEQCGMPFEGDITESFQCSNCRDLPLHFESARSAVKAGGTVMEAIHRYKYQQALWLEPFLADFLVREAAPALCAQGWNLLVPVPLHPAKNREREFNQAERLCRSLSRATGLPVETGLVRRARHTLTQTHLSRRERIANLRNAFIPIKNHRLNGRGVILIDDVLTTGATTSECARVLKKMGADRVCVWTVARSTHTS